MTKHSDNPILMAAAIGLMLFVAVDAHADASPLWPGPETATVIRVIDGDTIDVLTVNGTHERVRLLGVDAPELHGPMCHEELTKAKRAREVVVEMVYRRTVIITEIRKLRDKYDRTLARVHASGGEDLSSILIEAGLAREYSGKKRQPWCETNVD